eukprot:1850389-Rhodomonas_salina.13
MADTAHVPEGWQRVVDDVEPSTLPQGSNQSPLDVLSAMDVMKIMDCGDGWVVMSNAAEPLLFASEESTWYGKMFAGSMRQSEFLLLDVNRRPIVSATKPFSWTSQGAGVKAISANQAETAAVENDLGSIQQEFGVFKRRLLVRDATPNHAAGTLVIEAAITDPTFHITLDGQELGTIVQPKNGMGVATLALQPGALDPFRSNRMRALLLCATLMVCDMYWSMSPGVATAFKFPLPH